MEKNIKVMRVSGMSYEQASLRALNIIEDMHKTGTWHDDVDELIDLRRIMRISWNNEKKSA